MKAKAAVSAVIAAAAFATAVVFAEEGSSPVCPTKPARLGCSVHKPKQTLALPVQASSTFPDISSYQGCPTISSPVVFKIYEGNYGQDRSALCNATQVHRKHLYAGVYAFLRPVNPEAQADRTVEVLKAIGGVPGPVVADAEVPLPAGYVTRFLLRIRQRIANPVAIYTSPGTWPGGPVNAGLWVATYGPRPGCVGSVCRFLAWQFSSTYRCQGIVGDCSVNYGLVTPANPPIPKPDNSAKIAYLRSLARKHSCYRHGRKPHACYVWGNEVRQLQKS